MSKRVASVLFFLVALAACGKSSTAAPKTPVVDPLCRTAEQMSPGSRLAAATDGATPRYAVRLRGPGELAVGGFVNEHNATLIDLATGEVSSRTSTGSCAAKFIKLPTEQGGYGEFCVVIEPIKPKAYSTFDLGFATEPHKAPDDAAAAAKICL